MNNDVLTTAGLSTTFLLVIGMLYKIYSVVNHKRIRSNCCGKKLVASIDIENTTPTNQPNNDINIEDNTTVNPLRPYLNTRPITIITKK